MKFESFYFLDCLSLFCNLWCYFSLLIFIITIFCYFSITKVESFYFLGSLLRLIYKPLCFFFLLIFTLTIFFHSYSNIFFCFLLWFFFSGVPKVKSFYCFEGKFVIFLFSMEECFMRLGDFRCLDMVNCTLRNIHEKTSFFFYFLTITYYHCCDCFYSLFFFYNSVTTLFFLSHGYECPFIYYVGWKTREEKLVFLFSNRTNKCFLITIIWFLFSFMFVLFFWFSCSLYFHGYVVFI